MRRWILVGSAAIGLLVVVCTGWLGWRVWTVASELDALVPLAGQARTALENGDGAAFAPVAEALAEGAARASSATADPVWRAAEALPGVGENLVAARVVADELERVAAAAPGLVGFAESMGHREPGTLLDTAALAADAPMIEESARSLAAAHRAVHGLATDSLLSPVEKGVGRMRDVLDTLLPLSETAAGAARVLPSALGGNGERTILLMVQNPAELRTGGGISGTFVELRAEAGRLSLTGQSDSSAFARRDTPLVDVPTATTALFGDGVARYVQNASMTPDFALSGELASSWWTGLTGRRPDMVIAVDPYVLQALLTVTGPVVLESGESLDAANVLDALLVQPYVSMSSDEQTELFSSAVEAVFSRVAEGSIDAVALVRAVEQTAVDGRISVWSRHTDEQEVLEASPIGGPMARQDTAGRGAFAVYFNDATGGKLAGFLDVAIDAQRVECRSDGLTDIAVTVTMGSHAPLDVGSLPVSVTGGGLFGVGVGDIGTNVTVAAPVGSFVGAVQVKGEPYPATTAIDAGRAASTARVNLSPGEVNELKFHFLVDGDDAESITVLHTPLMNPAVITVGGACSAEPTP